MIYLLKEFLKKDSSLSVINYIKDQVSILLDNSLDKNKIYELSYTTHFFIDVDEKLNVLGIIVITSQTFLFDNTIFFIEYLNSKNNNYLVEQSLLLKGINHVFNISKNSKIISFIENKNTQENVLSPFGFVNSNGLMVKI